MRKENECVRLHNTFFIRRSFSPLLISPHFITFSFTNCLYCSFSLICLIPFPLIFSFPFFSDHNTFSPFPTFPYFYLSFSFFYSSSNLYFPLFFNFPFSSLSFPHFHHLIPTSIFFYPFPSPAPSYVTQTLTPFSCSPHFPISIFTPSLHPFH